MSIAIGNVQTVVVCIPGSLGIQGACPAGHVQSVTQAYLIAASESINLDLMAQPFDSSAAGHYFGFAFASTLFLYLFALSVGSVVSFLRRS